MSIERDIEGIKATQYLAGHTVDGELEEDLKSLLNGDKSKDELMTKTLEKYRG